MELASSISDTSGVGPHFRVADCTGADDLDTATRNALAYQPLSDTLLFVDQDLGHRFSVLKGREFGTTTRIVSQTGPVGVRQIPCRPPKLILTFSPLSILGFLTFTPFMPLHRPMAAALSAM